jgi:hypothetical protein
MIRLAGYSRMFCMVAIASTLCAQAPSTPAQELGDGFAYINK